MSSPELLTPEEYTSKEIEVANYRIPYGKDSEQFGDLFLPRGDGPYPVVVMIHGGCWRAQYGIAPMGRMSRAIADVGIAVWSLEYRRLGNGGGWPNTFFDVAAAADMLPDLAAEHDLDLSRVIAVGHSAGGHLALWLGGRRRLSADAKLYKPNPLPLKSIVALAPVCDLERAVAWDICVEASDVLVGGHPRKVAANYYEGSPAALLPLGVPHVNINGELDDIVPIDYVHQFVKTARNCGDDSTLVGIPGVGHFEIVDPDQPACQLVIRTIMQQFAKLD